MRLDARRALVLLLAGLVGIVVTVIAAAPASFADSALGAVTNGRVRLAEAEGTIWRGSGRLVLADLSAAAAELRSTAGVAIPGRVHWSIRALPLLVGQFDARIGFDGMAQPVRVNGGYDEIRIAGGTLGLPSVDLSRLGSPWNTVRPSGALHLAWENLVIRDGGLDGHARIELRDASSAMTPVRPLGSYRVDVVGRGRRAELSIATMSGPLQLQGNGTFDPNAGLRFTAEASAGSRERMRLESFLGLMGRREGDRTIIKIGA